MDNWNPWTIDNGTLQLNKWPDHEPGSVLVDVDVFEPFGGEVRNRYGELLINCPNCGIEPYRANEPPLPDGCEDRDATHSDILNRLFRHIDAHPQTHYVLRTKRPERVRECWPEAGACESCGGTGCHADSAGFTGSACGVCRGEGRQEYRPNVTLQLGPIHTQADADRLLPAGLECSDLVGSVEVYCQPTERIDFRPWLQPDHWEEQVGAEEWVHRNDCPCCGTGHMPPRFPRIVVGGGDAPLHPDNVRCARDQAVAAGIEFVFESWGDYGPVCSKRTASVVVYRDGRWCDFTREAIVAEERRSGKDHDRCSPHTMFRVGREHSGRELDGRTWPRTGAS